MAEVYFDIRDSVHEQAADPDNQHAADADLQVALAEAFRDLAFDRRELRFHDRDGYMAEWAGSDACRALRHHYDLGEGSWMPYEDHPNGWDGRPLCQPTRSSPACCQCESLDDCTAARLDVSIWRLDAVTGESSPAPADAPVEGL